MSKVNGLILRTRITFYIPKNLYRISVDDRQAADFAGLIKTVSNKCIHMLKHNIMMLSDSI